MKKLLPYILILIVLASFVVPAHFSLAFTCTTAPTCQPPSVLTSDGCSCTYVLLSPLPNTNGETLNTFDPTGEGGGALGGYLNLMIKLFIGICAVLAVIMIVMGGIQYMTTELISSKEEGRKRITGAILGLLLALGAYTLLFTINPDLLNTDLESLEDVTVVVDLGGESPDPFVAISKTALQSFGITKCTGSGGKSAVAGIGQQFVGKTTYSQATGKRNTINSSIITLDCSAFVAQVYSCAGLSYTGGNTNEMFGSGATAVNGTTYDFSQLHSGDLVGWKKGDKGGGKVETNGHVAIYLGNGQILDTQSGGTAVRQLDSIKNRITYVKWP
ncbi:MAG: hypothetical protein UU82_C0012G0006 [Candidatus Nomurabacteria bacterium GW2011_GWC2_41_8]|uniref:NlpC/P60 domain-containing protein n=3 Tax=Candidatus Nomuraibacteriota TaxID=1752729 RepID=A0A1F6YCW7_9BACT|nr:MAG: hypothetical protein UU58_C0005G0023 [Candidatus Nomurabacteria bacterium GW2011_GWA2_41_25]KKS24059.1 MAG: hypothetical protein UU82_C0012G0006 [Candidatus Nomurabacteria bacterium GW2011_GWC2_41_8]OGI67343.1 MAG: hypothetical protein A2823_00040 [Candidatus Nomurabacteria bacterium RIFCSPHIGHO2_01_FULL_41_91]OGI80628.1 MAG: hypothetical protein A3D43_00655 [Candidatus Nomurabacteria bacterium RIFCSPHIGHO2_02_FULL_41_52]OGI84902.1 MAG: hypothetical protein A3F49_00045 [Candidatus Nomur